MSSTESEVVSANQGLPSLSLWQLLWKEVVVSADRKVRPKSKRAPEDERLVARIDPELDEIRYGGTHHDGKSVADINGLNVHLSEKFQVQFLEITVITKGDSEKMRHTDRTQRISFGWLKQQFERGVFNVINVGTDEPVADMFTKPFADKTQWNKALALINRADCSKKARPESRPTDCNRILVGFVLIPTASLDSTDMHHAVVMLLESRRNKMLPG